MQIISQKLLTLQITGDPSHLSGGDFKSETIMSKKASCYLCSCDSDADFTLPMMTQKSLTTLLVVHVKRNIDIVVRLCCTFLHRSQGTACAHIYIILIPISRSRLLTLFVCTSSNRQHSVTRTWGSCRRSIRSCHSASGFRQGAHTLSARPFLSGNGSTLQRTAADAQEPHTQLLQRTFPRLAPGLP